MNNRSCEILWYNGVTSTVGWFTVACFDHSRSSPELCCVFFYNLTSVNLGQTPIPRELHPKLWFQWNWTCQNWPAGRVAKLACRSHSHSQCMSGEILTGAISHSRGVLTSGELNHSCGPGVSHRDYFAWRKQEQQEWFSQGYLYIRWNLKAYGGIICNWKWIKWFRP
jgi:hypothetical protein